MNERLYLTSEELEELGVDLDKLNNLRRKAVLDEQRVFITVATLRQVETVARDHKMSFVTHQRYSQLHKEGVLNLEPGTILGPMHVLGNFMVTTK